MALDDTENLTFGKLTHRHNQLARLLASGLSWDAAGEAIGASRSTVARMMRRSDMRSLVDQWRQQNVDGVLGALIPEALASIRHLASVRDNPEASEHLRVMACKEILQSVARLGRQPAIAELTSEQARELFISEAERIRAERDDGDEDV